jgi:hypothetical protein
LSAVQIPQSFTLTAYLVKQPILSELSVVPVGSTQWKITDEDIAFLQQVAWETVLDAYTPE